MLGTEIVGVATFLPERIVTNADAVVIRGLPNNYGVSERRFAWPDYTSATLAVRACQKLFETTGVSGKDIDVVVCTALLQDLQHQGIAAEVQYRIGATNATIVNLNVGCTDFLSALNIARGYIESGLAKTVLIATATNFVSRLDETFRDEPSAWALGDGGITLGDGASATLLRAGRRSILASHEQAFGEVFGLMKFKSLRSTANYWEAGATPFTVHLSPEMFAGLTARALEIVPAAILKALERAQLAIADVKILITHQPNQFFLNQWRDRLGIEPARAHDTLARYGNLFAGTIPITLADALDRGRVQSGDVLAFGTFANAGDHVSAMVVQW